MRYKNLCDFIDNELKELDRKAASDGSLTAQEVEFADLLTHMKKSMLTSEAMEGGYSENRGSVTYRNDGYGDGYSDGYNDGYERRSYSEGHGYGARDRKGRYSRMYRDDGGDMMSELQKMADKAPNDQVKRRYREFMDELKDMM